MDDIFRNMSAIVEIMTKQRILQLLKIIGILLFAWILSRTDRVQLLSTLQQINWMIFLAAIPCFGGIYLTKTLRWHALVQATGLRPTLKESWQLYMIGIFLGNITPAKIGELGRAAYLKKQGLSTKIGILLSIVDRAADAIIIAIFGALSVGILIKDGWVYVSYATLILLIIALCILHIYKKIISMTLPFVKIFLRRIHPHLVHKVIITTILGWIFYFAWAVLLARSLGITIEVHILVATFTITGLVAMLPIAPSGLGTRDAVLVMLLRQYGVSAEHAVALALLMFTVIILMSMPGGWYWLQKSDKKA